LYCTDGTDTTLPRARSASASDTTRSASSQSGPVRGPTSIPARSWNSVRTNPGHSAIARTRVPSSEPATPSVNEMTQALSAP